MKNPACRNRNFHNSYASSQEWGVLDLFTAWERGSLLLLQAFFIIIHHHRKKPFSHPKLLNLKQIFQAVSASSKNQSHRFLALYVSLTLLKLVSFSQCILMLWKQRNQVSDSVDKIKLRDGRFLAYKESGVPKDEAKYKIILIHGFGSSKEMNFSASKVVNNFTRFFWSWVLGFGEVDYWFFFRSW